MLPWFFAAIVAVVILALLWALSTYNELVRRKNVASEAWSDVATQLERRADLIPNLVATVKGYAAHERKTLDELTELRAATRGQDNVATRAPTEEAISGALGRLFAVAEAYPDLKASEQFRLLQQDLAQIEDQIQLARRFYNGAARDLNVMIAQAPSNIIARYAAFAPAPFFDVEKAANRAVPEVAF